MALAPEILDRYVGRYQFSPSDILTVTRDGDRLYGQPLGEDKIELFAEAEHEFFLKLLDAQLSFVPASGRATAAIWHQGGQDQRGERLE